MNRSPIKKCITVFDFYTSKIERIFGNNLHDRDPAFLLRIFLGSMVESHSIYDP